LSTARSHLFAAPQQRHGNDSCADPRGLSCAGTVLDHLAAKLVTEHHVLIRSHEGVVAQFGHHVGEFVAVVARMQVGSADATPKDVDQQLTLGRRRVGRSTTSSFALVQVTVFIWAHLFDPAPVMVFAVWSMFFATAILLDGGRLGRWGVDGEEAAP
jgi:hypothetical protein